MSSVSDAKGRAKQEATSSVAGEEQPGGPKRMSSIAGSHGVARPERSPSGFLHTKEAEHEAVEVNQQASSTRRPEPLPWHIKLLGVAFVIYVVLRLVQMVGWLIRWLSGQ